MAGRKPEGSTPARDADPDPEAGTRPARGVRGREETGGRGQVGQPSIGETLRALENVRLRSIALTLLLVLALIYALYVARAFLLPVVIALLLGFLLSPVVRGLRHLRVPTPVGAALVMLALLGVVGLAVYELSDPAQEWLAKAPRAVADLNAKLREIKQPVEDVSRAAEQLESAAVVGGDKPAREVVVREPSLVSRAFETTPALVGGIFEVLVLLYFLLAAGDLFLEKLIKVLPQLQDKKKAVRIARETESSISTYLATVTLLNLGEGLLLALAMWALGMPAPFLWGALAAVVEFVPYLGAVAMLGLLTIVALTTFDSVGQALLVPASFLAINLVQANLIFPLLHGRRLTLNPVAIVLGLAFWWWLWGVPGAFLAVPLLATFKIFCDHIEALAPIGEFLGR